MKARVIKTGEIVHVMPYSTLYKEKGQDPREWTEDELEFIINDNSSKMILIHEVCNYLKSLTYQEYPGGPIERLINDEYIEEFKKRI